MDWDPQPAPNVGQNKVHLLDETADFIEYLSMTHAELVDTYCKYMRLACIAAARTEVIFQEIMWQSGTEGS